MNKDIPMFTDDDRDKIKELNKDTIPFFIGHHINEKNRIEEKEKSNSKKSE